MFSVIVVSHGNLSKVLLETAEMIVGEQEGVETFGLRPVDNVDDLRRRVDEAVRRHLKENDVMILTDMQSGSPFNVAVSVMDEHKVRHFTGMNLPMLLEVLCNRASFSIDEVSEEIVERAQQSILDVNKYLDELDEE